MAAPAAAMDNPNPNKRRNNFSLSSWMVLAMHIAPNDDSGLMSTKWASTLTEEIIATALPPPIFVINSGTKGMNVGNTTPEELENADITPVVKAVTAVTFWGVDTLASKSVNKFNPPMFSRTTISVLMPHTIRMTSCLRASLPSLPCNSARTLASVIDKKPMSAFRNTAQVINMNIAASVNF